MPFDCPSARGRRGQCVICSRLWIDYIGRIHKAREIRCNLSKTMQSDQAGVAAAIDCDGSFRLGHGIICGIVGGDYRKTIGCGAVVALRIARICGRHSSGYGAIIQRQIGVLHFDSCIALNRAVGEASLLIAASVSRRRGAGNVNSGSISAIIAGIDLRSGYGQIQTGIRTIMVKAGKALYETT